MKALCVLMITALLLTTGPTASTQTAAHKALPSKAALAVPTQPYKGPTQDDLTRVAAIKADIAVIERQVAEAQSESEKLAGGLIKARIDARIAQMKYTISLLQTRQKALELGARLIPVEIASSTIDEATVAKLDKEIEEQRAKIAETDAKAAQYSGGLIRAQILSTSATMSETLALMEQRRVIAKYGLVPAPAAKSGTDTASISSSAQNQASGPKERPLKDTIIKVRLTNKQFHEYKYDKSIFFDGEYIAEGLDKPTRSIKGVFSVQDLFGETKVPIKWTITQPMAPGQSVSFSGKGIDYNQFTNSHQWLRSTLMSDMQVVFSVESIIYDDGTRRDF